LDKSLVSSSILWLFTVILVYIIGLVFTVGVVETPKSIQESLIKERTINHSVSADIDDYGWQHADQRPLFQYVTDYISERFSNTKSLLDGKQGAVESVWANAPYTLKVYGALLDYRLGVVIPLAIGVGIFWLSLMVDGWIKRKISMYRFSFASVTGHTIGGRILGLYLGLFVFLGFFLPIAVPFWVLLILLLIKAIGWWIWVINLPKRM
jgi:hypothetical protein